jgi:archaemetzincin
MLRKTVFVKPISLLVIGFLGSIFMFSCEITSYDAPDENTVVAIQPFTGFSLAYADTVKLTVMEMYGVQAQVLDPIAMPQNAFVHIKSPRYRADTLIHYLKNDPLFAKHDHVIGLISKDISTTKYSDFKNKIIKEPVSKYSDWGIFGLGFMPGKSCIVSSYRLEMDVPKEQFVARLKKVSCHELGHNFGLPHCPNKTCIMQDAAETIKTIDNVSLHLCDECKAKIGIPKGSEK